MLTGNTTPAFPSYHHKSNICSFCYNTMIVTLFYSEFSYAPLAVKKFQILFCKTCSCESYCLPILDDVLPCVWTADSVKWIHLHTLNRSDSERDNRDWFFKTAVHKLCSSRLTHPSMDIGSWKQATREVYKQEKFMSPVI